MTSSRLRLLALNALKDTPRECIPSSLMPAMSFGLIMELSEYAFATTMIDNHAEFFRGWFRNGMHGRAVVVILGKYVSKL